MAKRLILVDVDGVLNPFLRPNGLYRLHTAQGGHQSWKVWLNPQHGEMLLQLAEEAGAQLVWATMWEHWANRSISPLIGLPDTLPVIEWESDHGQDVGWLHPKTRTVAKWVGDADWVWFDDELTRHDTTWLKSWPGIGRFRLMHTSSKRGLTDRHIAQAGRFFAELDA